MSDLLLMGYQVSKNYGITNVADEIYCNRSLLEAYVRTAMPQGHGFKVFSLLIQRCSGLLDRQTRGEFWTVPEKTTPRTHSALEGVRSTIFPNVGLCTFASPLGKVGRSVARAQAQGMGLPAAPAAGRLPAAYQGPL